MRELSVLLKEYGLDDMEIALYLTLVGKGRLTAYAIAKDAKIHRSTAYDVLSRLVSRGFLGTLREGTKTTYALSSPNRILSDIKSKEALVTQIAHELSIAQPRKHTTIQYLEGVESQKQFNIDAFERIRSGNVKQILVLGNGPSWTVGSELLVSQLVREFSFMKKKAVYRAIWDTRYKKSALVKQFTPLGEQRYLSLPSLTTTVILDDMAALLFSTNEPKALTINEPKVAAEMRAYFEHLWAIAKK
jgi:sugar-specific transcriptional regulator TrmB